MDDCIVEINDISFQISNQIKFEEQHKKFFSEFKYLFNQKNSALKKAFEHSLKDISIKVNIFKWNINIYSMNHYKEDKTDEIIFLFELRNLEDVGCRYFCCEVEKDGYDENHLSINKNRLNISCMRETEECFLRYLNENDLYLSKNISLENTNIIGTINELHINNIKLFQELDLMLESKYSNYFCKNKIEYCIGKKILIANPFDGILQESISHKSILKGLFKDGGYCLNIAKEELDLIFESDDISEIIENIKLLSY